MPNSTPTTTTSIRETLLSRLGITYPIIQAPMAGVSTPALAAAVSQAGGLGSLGLGAMNANSAREAIRQTRALTDRPFGVNLFCHQPTAPDDAASAAWLAYLKPRFDAFDAQVPKTLAAIYTSFVTDTAMLDMLIEEKPAVVSFHFGLPDSAAIAALRHAGVYLMATATSLDEAERIRAAGVHAIVAQGIEAGGHRGIFDPHAYDDKLGTFALTRLLVSQQPLPVIAAGGIMDGAGIRAALTLGAHAAQLGTAFVTCPESSADAAHRTRLLGAGPHSTTLTTAISGRLARSLVNEFTALGETSDRPPTPGYPMTYDAGKALNAAAKTKGVSDYGAQWAGQACALSRGLPATELMAALIEEAGCTDKI